MTTKKNCEVKLPRRSSDPFIFDVTERKTEDVVRGANVNELKDHYRYKWGRSDQKQKLSFRDYALKLETMLASLLAVFLLVFFRNEIVSLCSFAFEMCGGEAVLEIVDILVLLVFCGWFVAYSNGEYGRLKKRDWQRFSFNSKNQ